MAIFAGTARRAVNPTPILGSHQRVRKTIREQFGELHRVIRHVAFGQEGRPVKQFSGFRESLPCGVVFASLVREFQVRDELMSGIEFENSLADRDRLT